MKASEGTSPPRKLIALSGKGRIVPTTVYDRVLDMALSVKESRKESSFFFFISPSVYFKLPNYMFMLWDESALVCTFNTSKPALVFRYLGFILYSSTIAQHEKVKISIYEAVEIVGKHHIDLRLQWPQNFFCTQRNLKIDKNQLFTTGFSRIQ